MRKKTPFKKKHKLHHKIVKKLFQKGSIALIMLMLVTVGLGIMLASTPKFDAPQEAEPPKNSCLDYDPPNASISIMYNGSKYNLIKKDAGISSNKMNEMTLVGNYNNQDLYIMSSNDYFGNPPTSDVVYALVKQGGGYHYFDIYIKDGVQIPDSIKNSPSIGGGGSQQVIIDDSSSFPPAGFNSSDISNLSITLSQPAFIYMQNKTTLSSISGLPGIQQIGTLSYNSRQLSVYYHLATIYLVDGNDAYEYIPTDTPVDFKTVRGTSGALQAKKFTVKTVSVNPICWYTPVCKPVVYLYPEKKTRVFVKIDPQGMLTYSIPDHGAGWDVTAYPNGKIVKDDKEYPYLYYETAIEDSKIEAPKKGFVVKFDELPSLYERILPDLGLRGKEITEFVDYWKKTLPQSPYYFVGILSNSNIDFIEKMTISPKPQQTIRVRIFFEALKDYKYVEEPTFSPVERIDQGFLVVEWGGLVKTDPNSEFTCSQ